MSGLFCSSKAMKARQVCSSPWDPHGGWPEYFRTSGPTIISTSGYKKEEKNIWYIKYSVRIDEIRSYFFWWFNLYLYFVLVGIVKSNFSNLMLVTCLTCLLFPYFHWLIRIKTVLKETHLLYLFNMDCPPRGLNSRKF